MTLQFETMTPAGMFGSVCETPIMDLRAACPDDVIKNVPRFFDRWEDGTSTQVLLEDNWSITASEDACEPSAASREILDCTMLLPDQEQIAIGLGADVQFRDLMRRFCDAKRIVKFPTLFRADGSFDTGQPLSGEFIYFLLGELRGPFMKHLRYSFWSGSSANMHEFDGVLTQLNAGVLSSGGGCEPLNHVSLDWATLTGNPGGVSAPDATIDAANDAITIHGEVYTGMTGLNMVEFLRLWMERLMEYEFANYALQDIEFELWVPNGQTTCIAELAACMQPCDGCVDPLSDPGIRARAASFRRDKIITLYPYDDVPITIRTTRALGDDYLFVPKMVAGRPTIGWVFRDMQRELEIANGVIPFYGSQVGPSEPYEPLYSEDEIEMDPATLFESRFARLNVQRNQECLNVWLTAEAAVLLFARHTWVQFSGMNCAGLVPADCEQSMSVAASACDVVALEEQQLTFTVDLDAQDPQVGDTYAVYFVDGITTLLGTVVSYDAGTDALVLEFAVAVDADTGGGCTTAVLSRWAQND
jgi:hypothetical protein